MRFVYVQELHAHLDDRVAERRHGLIEHSIQLAANHGTEAVWSVGHTIGVAQLATPRNDIVQRKTMSREDLIDHQVYRVIGLPSKRDPQGILLLFDVRHRSESCLR